MSGNGIPLRPDLGATIRRERRAIERSLAGCVLAKIHNARPIQFVERQWSDDSRAAILTRAAVSPDSTTGSASALSVARVSPLLLIAPPSAAAKLFDRALKVDLTGIAQVNVPHVAAHPAPLFVGEGEPIPVVQAATSGAVIGPAHKLAFIIGITNELDEATPETASVVLGRLMGEAAAKSLDAYVFDANPADATRPAGLLNGVTQLSAAVNQATTLDQISAGIGLFAQAFSDAGINSDNMCLITSPRSAWQFLLTRGFQTLPSPVLMSPAITPGTVIAVVPEAIGSGYASTPEVEVAKMHAVHFDDTIPQQIGTPGSPNVIATPTRSFFQQDMLAVKLRVKCAWASLQPGAVQFMTGILW
jgi:hypothetical protein